MQDVIVRAQTVPLLHHVVIARLVREATAEACSILQLVGGHLAHVVRLLRHCVIARLHAHVAAEVDPLPTRHLPAKVLPVRLHRRDRHLVRMVIRVQPLALPGEPWLATVTVKALVRN